MIRNIKIDDIIKNFKQDGNALEYAKEYGIYEVIDGHLYYNYDGYFTEEEIEEIIEVLANVFNI